MNYLRIGYLLLVVGILLAGCKTATNSSSLSVRKIISFNDEWRFSLENDSAAVAASFDDSKWRELSVPHDWSIEGSFREDAPAGVGGGALPGGTGWYRKTFILSEEDKTKKIFIDFDGVYCNSDVWINGEHLGHRPNGYISFRYELTPHLLFDKPNVITVKVDNSQQPNSRWYSGSGIYRNVWLVKTDPVFVDHYGTFITTPQVTAQNAEIIMETNVRNDSEQDREVLLKTIIYDQDGKQVAVVESSGNIAKDSMHTFTHSVVVQQPIRWSVESPYLYKAVSYIYYEGESKDSYETPFGIRSFEFNANKGFSLNGVPMKILGVCNHHDLGCLGAAVNYRALERQLEILKEMGVNGIRTAHNPPTPELLDLCDKMGFIVMDEVFDMWKKKKTPFDYSMYWDEWHEQDLQDFIRRDRNHPSVMIWSIGNEIGEQWDSTGTGISKRLASIVRGLDSTRPITTGNNEVNTSNSIIKSGELDIIGYNYNHKDFSDFHKRYPGKRFIATETTSALATRGHYDMPSDSVRRWPISWDKLFTEGNKDNTVSAYDNVSAPWGSTHEETWKVMKKHDHLSGMFIWTGFDYLGEPTPYVWPSRSSYFGVIDLAGFPKDAFYMYQSEWTNKPMLHIFPHWNWKHGETIDIWAYYNQADEVELFINNDSQGVKKKQDDDLHVMWRVKFAPGSIRVISRKDGKEVLVKEVKTAGEATKIVLEADRSTIQADGKDLSFVKVKVVDKDGNLVPKAGNNITFHLSGEAVLAGVDNGDPTSHLSFRGNAMQAFNGLCLAIVQSKKEKGVVTLKAESQGLESASIKLTLK